MTWAGGESLRQLTSSPSPEPQATPALDLGICGNLKDDQWSQYRMTCQTSFRPKDQQIVEDAKEACMVFLSLVVPFLGSVAAPRRSRWVRRAAEKVLLDP